ncbi:MAG TPA: hypothetical protein P5277_04620 [Candidatus Paceibacterota bacterium]|nr:hypothetical protein [Candidatus Paceibacterota bacterium]
METTILAAVFGCLGGLTRSAIGIFKAHVRHEKIKIGFIIRTIKLSVLSGTFIGAIFSFNPLISYIAGYVGSDIMEGVYVSFKRTKIGKRHFEL